MTAGGPAPDGRPPEDTDQSAAEEERPLPWLDELKTMSDKLNAGIQTHLDHLANRRRKTGG
ncbi:hypothetical protein ABZS86_15070 [Streptomyces sp. NPDC005355]|uniref:hypothetical protein n=1 Tax=Streptomyces sp. NPDC005355 TaxID=3157038 RepID=UPI00339FA7AD